MCDKMIKSICTGESNSYVDYFDMTFTLYSSFRSIVSIYYRLKRRPIQSDTSKITIFKKKSNKKLNKINEENWLSWMLVFVGVCVLI